jgi:uncharacterized repeat protein (TIGR04138 family)
MKDRSLARQGQVGAEAVCRVLLELAVDHFAESGKDELIGWGFGSSTLLGSYIYQLADQGAIELSETDQLSDFDGWYDLANDPGTWKLKW